MPQNDDSPNAWPPPANIIYHEGPCIVVNKPAGVATQAPPGIPNLESMVREYIRKREEKAEGQKFYLGVPHRLDRPVTGAVVFGRHIRATRRLSDQFAAKTIGKTYVALVEQAAVKELPQQGTLTDWLRKVPGKAHVEVTDDSASDAKQAILHYELTEEIGDLRKVVIQLETGRTHQIRIQLASRGMPIVGDSQYGSTQSFGPTVTDERRSAIGLHAQRLAFSHPMTRDPVEVVAPFPAYWPNA